MGPRSFLCHITPGSGYSRVSNYSDVLEMACLRLFPYSGKVAFMNDLPFRLGVNGSELPEMIGIDEDTIALILPHSHTDFSRQIKDAYREAGIPGVRRLDTAGIILMLHRRSLYFINGFTGSVPVYYCTDGQNILVSTEIKSIVAQDIIPLSIAGKEAFRIEPYFRPSGHCPVDGLVKIDAGKILKVDLSDASISILPDLDRTIYHHASLKQTVQTFHDLLDEIVKQNSANKAVVGIPLSGGYDSGTIAGLASKYTDIHSFTMGTEEVNEFDGARQMSDSIGSSHHEYVIDESELIPAILQGIYLNELADPLYAEGYSGLYFIYRMASAMVDDILTGYGADLSLSNFLGGPLDEMAVISDKLIRRTSWTGELSPFVPAQFGLRVIHPFLNRSLVDYILSMPSEFKVSKGMEKFIERELILEYQLMPRGLLGMKKKALHTGAGIDKLFNKMLGIEKDEKYIIKSEFLFNAWKELIFNNVRAPNVDIDKLVYLTKQAAL